MEFRAILDSGDYVIENDGSIKRIFDAGHVVAEENGLRGSYSFEESDFVSARLAHEVGFQVVDYSDGWPGLWGR